MNRNLNHPQHPWARLTRAARAVRDERDATAPYGFATRVAALALAPERALSSLFERFALRALGVACLLALGSVALNYREVAGAGWLGGANVEAEVLSSPDVVAVVLDLAD